LAVLAYGRALPQPVEHLPAKATAPTIGAERRKS